MPTLIIGIMYTYCSVQSTCVHTAFNATIGLVRVQYYGFFYCTLILIIYTVRVLVRVRYVY